MNLDRNYAIGAEAIASALQKPKRVRSGKYVACCPAHDDNNPSLSIEDAASGKVLVKCWAGCSQDAVIDALRNLDLWHKPARARIQYLENKSLKAEIWRHQMLLATETTRAEQGYVHTEFERAQIKRSIQYLEEHADG